MTTPDGPAPRHRADGDRREALVAAAATDDLTPDEQAELDAVVADRPEVRDEVEALHALVRRVDRVGTWEPVTTTPGRLDAVVRDLAGPGARRGTERGGMPARGPGRLRRGVAALGLVAAGSLGTLGLQSVLEEGPVEGPPGTLGAVEDVALTPEGDASDSADVEAHLVAHTWGTEAVLHVEGLESGTTYEVALVDADGDAVPAGAFLGSEVPIDCRLNAAVLREQVTGVRISTTDGAVVRSAEVPRLG